MARFSEKDFQRLDHANDAVAALMDKKHQEALDHLRRASAAIEARIALEHGRRDVPGLSAHERHLLALAS